MTRDTRDSFWLAVGVLLAALVAMWEEFGEWRKGEE